MARKITIQKIQERRLTVGCGNAFIARNTFAARKPAHTTRAVITRHADVKIDVAYTATLPRPRRLAAKRSRGRVGFGAILLAGPRLLLAREQRVTIGRAKLPAVPL